jgi:hypothetical protein
MYHQLNCCVHQFQPKSDIGAWDDAVATVLMFFARTERDSDVVQSAQPRQYFFGGRSPFRQQLRAERKSQSASEQHPDARRLSAGKPTVLTRSL